MKVKALLRKYKLWKAIKKDIKKKFQWYHSDGKSKVLKMSPNEFYIYSIKKNRLYI